jgi:hypothetical protein
MCFPKADAYPVGVFNNSIHFSNSRNSSSESIYGAAGLNIFLGLLGFLVSHKCLHKPLLCRSHLTFTVFLFPQMVFTKFFAMFISQCITSRVYWMNRSCIKRTVYKMSEFYSTTVSLPKTIHISIMSSA